jgi:hypothetical protein
MAEHCVEDSGTRSDVQSKEALRNAPSSGNAPVVRIPLSTNANGTADNDVLRLENLGTPVFVASYGSTPGNGMSVHGDRKSVECSIENVKTRSDLDLARGERTTKGTPNFDVTPGTVRNPRDDQLPHSWGKLRQSKWARRLRPRKPGTT